jgi:hypothetical protein
MPLPPLELQMPLAHMVPSVQTAPTAPGWTQTSSE